jgi:membrane-associated protein
VFAETGLFFGFFLPGDSLLFVAGIYSAPLAAQIFASDNEWLNLFIIFSFISAAGILGNYVGYQIGNKVGPAMYDWKENIFFKKKYLVQAQDFYEKHGGRAIVIARFIPIVRTFAPIVAGIVKMDKAKFTYFNVVGCLAWVASMLCAGHFLQAYVLNQFQFDLKKHLEIIVLVIVFVTTAPVIFQVIKHRAQK